MTAFKEFAAKLERLEKLLGNDPYTPIPDKVWQTPVKALDRLLEVLKPYYEEPKVPTKADIKTVKDHGITAEIKTFIDRDRERKAFFSVNYFKQKCENLLDRELVQALPGGKTRAAFLVTVLLYHYWKARPEPLVGLERARAEIEEDFKARPAAKQAEEAKALYNKLLREPDINRIVDLLQEKFPERDSVTAFAKTVSLKIPGGRKPVHERLAGKILKSGELVRAKF